MMCSSAKSAALEGGHRRAPLPAMPAVWARRPRPRPPALATTAEVASTPMALRSHPVWSAPETGFVPAPRTVRSPARRGTRASPTRGFARRVPRASSSTPARAAAKHAAWALSTTTRAALSARHALLRKSVRLCLIRRWTVSVLNTLFWGTTSVTSVIQVIVRLIVRRKYPV